MRESVQQFGRSAFSETSALEAFLERLSTSLREGLGVPTIGAEGLKDFSHPDRYLRLLSFVNNVRRLPSTVYKRLAVALNRDQIPSKLWLINELSKTRPLYGSRVVTIGGWYGILPLLLQCLYPSGGIRTNLVDVDPAACEVAAALLEGVVEDCTITCKDANQIDYREVREDSNAIVVNTICEHMNDFLDWFKLLPPGQWVALQSNDHVGCSEHVNCVASLEAFEAQAPLSETMFSGSLPLAIFQRFMLIGRR